MAGVAVTMALLAVSFQPFLLVVALPFVAAAYLIWQRATDGYAFGRGRRRRDDRFGAGARRAAAEAASGRRDPEEVFDEGSRFRERARRERRRARRRQRRGRDRGDDVDPQHSGDMSRREARRVLGVGADADADAVTAAYRERVKETHPDTDDGDEERFKRVTEAYERLSE